MKRSNRGIEFAIEVFVRGHSTGRSRTFPYEVSRVGPLWLMRDAPRKNPRDYRKEEWIAHDIEPREVDAIARQHARGRFFVCAMIAEGEPDAPTRIAYKALGYRLLATEGFFVQRMKRIPRPLSPVSIERVRTPDLAAQLGRITRTRPISSNLLGDDAPFRQYVALDGSDIVGRVRSVDAAELQLREAKTTLSAVVEAAEKGEPTTITKHGRPAAVVISHEEWTKLKTKVPSFADLLLAVPPLDPGDLPKRRPARIVRKGGVK